MSVFSGSEVQKKHILLGCTGSVAAVKVPLIIEQLFATSQGSQLEVYIVTTENALHFFHPHELIQQVKVFRDADEWNIWSQRGDPVLHIELRKWADIFVIAPLDANTLAKMAQGLCNNLLTSVVRAWDMHKPLLFCPAMNTYMWEHPFTAPHIATLRGLGYKEVPCIKKTLICGDTGYGAMAETTTIVEETLNHLDYN